MSCCPQAPKGVERMTQEVSVRVIGLDAHRSMAVVAVLETGASAVAAGLILREMR